VEEDESGFAMLISPRSRAGGGVSEGNFGGKGTPELQKRHSSRGIGGPNGMRDTRFFRITEEYGGGGCVGEDEVTEGHKRGDQ